MYSGNLFSDNSQVETNAPLAEKLRPKDLDDFFGQNSILSKNSLLRNAILNDKVGNFIFSGPPGVGKTTLIEIISSNTRSKVVKLNAVFSSIKELRNEIKYAKERLINSKRKTILFIDEVHRFTAVQQDALLPSIENGTITFIGATTENPFFAVNKALVSRSRIFTLLPLAENDLQKIIQKVITHYSIQKEDIQYHDFAYSLLKDDGVKTKIIKKYLPFINQQVNRFLQKMEFYINFQLDEAFSETIQSPLHEDFTYSSFSEGEKMRIDLALLFTWREVARVKNSVNTNLLIMDEVFDSSLDTFGTDDFLKIIRFIIKDANTFVISHKIDMQDKFENVLKFDKVKGFSQIVT